VKKEQVDTYPMMCYIQVFLELCIFLTSDKCDLDLVSVPNKQINRKNKY